MTRATTVIAFALSIIFGSSAFAQTMSPGSQQPSRTPPGVTQSPAMPSGTMPMAEPMKGMPASGMIATDMEAKMRLEADGYRDIKVMKDGDGMWVGTATRGAAQLNVKLDAQGKIMAQ